MNNIKFSTLAFAALVTLASCEKDLLTESEVDDEETEVSGQSPKATAHINVTTRGTDVDPSVNVVSDGRVYIFNQSGQCVSLLSTSETSNQASANLPAGEYTLYAVGSPDLSRFVLPTQKEATSSSVITRAEGMVMEDLMLKTANVTLADGEDINHDMVLDHKVLCIDHLEVKGVPDNVTKVEVSLSPLFKSIQLDGTYVATATESYNITLTQSASSSSTWQATPNQMLFPSVKTPTIKVSFTTSSGVKSYSYTASEELPANHHFTIVGTYTANRGVALTGILTASDWGEDRTITFGFNESNQDAIPVAGESYKGYKVLSVDEAHHTALVRSASVKYTAPAAKSSESDWLTALNTAMAAVDKPEGAVGDWRIPTYDEALIFVTNPALYPGKDSSPAFFCLYDGHLERVWASNLTTNPVANHSNTLVSTNYLRAVITIGY